MVTVREQPISAAAQVPSGSPSADAAQEWQTESETMKLRAARFWLNLLFWSTANVPAFVRSTVPFWVWATWLSSPGVRSRTMDNARHLLGTESTKGARRKLARRVIRSFYLFVYDVGRHAPQSLDDIAGDIRHVEGSQHFEAARTAGRGLIVATAHMGSFEVGIAALRSLEAQVTVVFQRDRLKLFETQRTQLRRSLGVQEVAVDDGLGSWAVLREVLQRGEIVLMQADRAMPGQRSLPVPFMDGEIDMPIGVAKLAALTGAPVLPVFTERHDDGTVSIYIEPAIEPPTPDAFYASRGAVPEAMTCLADVIEKHVKARPDQWLMVRRAWREDAAD